MATLNASTYRSLLQAQQHYLAQIDEVAETAREGPSSGGVSQARVYDAKVKEAQEGSGPLLEAEAEELGMSIKEVAQSVLSAYQDWKCSCGVIEGKRLKAKSDIRASQSPADMHRIVKKFKEVLNVVH